MSHRITIIAIIAGTLTQTACKTTKSSHVSTDIQHDTHGIWRSISDKNVSIFDDITIFRDTIAGWPIPIRSNDTTERRETAQPYRMIRRTSIQVQEQNTHKVNNVIRELEKNSTIKECTRSGGAVSSKFKTFFYVCVSVFIITLVLNRKHNE